VLPIGRYLAKVGHDRGEATLRQFKPYPAYKDSGVQWLGEIPAHWSALAFRRWSAVSNKDGVPWPKTGWLGWMSGPSSD
jgi:hypothetical protein